jgi:hypothetical protein
MLRAMSNAVSAKNSVYPSGGALAAALAAMVAPAPGRFSTKTCWPRLSDILAATWRASASAPPPAL